jgi:hypothetical protein
MEPSGESNDHSSTTHASIYLCLNGIDAGVLHGKGNGYKNSRQMGNWDMNSG